MPLALVSMLAIRWRHLHCHWNFSKNSSIIVQTGVPYKPSIHPKITQMEMVNKEFFFNSVRRKSETFITVQPDFGQYIVKLQHSDSQKDRNCVENYVYWFSNFVEVWDLFTSLLIFIKKNDSPALIQNKIWRQIVLFAQIFRILVNIFTDGQPW